MFHRKNPPPEPKTLEEKMDVMIMHLERMDRRDKMRMWGSFFHSLMTIIPMIFFVWSTWYLYAHFDDIMGTMLEQSAKSAAAATGQGYEDILGQLRDTFGMGEKEGGL